MAYIPKVNDPVFVAGIRADIANGKRGVRYVVISVDAKEKTVTVQSASGPVYFQHHNVSWSRLSRLDESQNALQIVREATEDK
jgi:hypothetical protein